MTHEKGSHGKGRRLLLEEKRKRGAGPRNVQRFRGTARKGKEGKKIRRGEAVVKTGLKTKAGKIQKPAFSRGKSHLRRTSKWLERGSVAVHNEREKEKTH